MYKRQEQMSAEKALPNHDPGDRVRDGRFAGMVPAADHRQICLLYTSDSCAHKAKLIISKSGELLRYDEYRALMDTQGV